MPKAITQARPFVVGVTGALGSGKSTVAAMFARLGATVINADLLAHRGMRPSGPCFKPIVRAFGKDIVSRAAIDRRALARRVFRDPAALKNLERIVHPYVVRETVKQIASYRRSGKDVVVLDVPLLFESGMNRLADLNISVKVNAAILKERILRQGRLNAAEARRRMRQQFSGAEKNQMADIVVDNSRSLNQTQKQIRIIWEMIQKRYVHRGLHIKS